MNPGYYRYIKYNDKCALRKSEKDIYKWNDSTIHKILSNEEYTGKIINRKYLYENGKRILNPNPIIIEHGLPQIIDEETFNKVKEIRSCKPKIPDRIYPNPFPNCIRCKCCGKVLNYTLSVTMNKFLYECRKCKTRIYLDDLKTIIFNDIKDQISQIDDNEVLDYCKTKNQKIKKEIKSIENEIQNTFEHFINDDITEAQIKPRIEELTEKKNHLLQQLSKKEEESILSLLLNLRESDIKVDLINKLVKDISVSTIGRRKYEVHINYNFKN